MRDQKETERLGREAGEAIANAIADNLETVILKLADSIAELQAQQANLSFEFESLRRLVSTLPRRPTNDPSSRD
jgi:predicted  nucleic acid-binding Zn-ribbon protein